MIYRTSLEDIREYHRSTSVNQTIVKVILKSGIQCFVDQAAALQREEEMPTNKEEKPHFIIGGAVDMKICCTPSEFTDTYHISTLIKKPGGKALVALNNAYDIVFSKYGAGAICPLEDMVYREEVWQGANEADYYFDRGKKGPEVDSRYDTLLKDNGAAYWQDLIESSGKQILSDAEINKIETIVKNFLNHPHTAYLFKDADDIDIVFQFPMEWTYENVPCKGLVDMIIINHTKRRIIPLDIKTIGDYILKFNQAIRKNRYDIQAAFYGYGLGLNIRELSAKVNRDLNSYIIARFAFIAESTTHPGTPMVFPLSEELLNEGRVGDGRYVLGWEQGIFLYRDWNNYDFSLEKRFAHTNGVAFVGAGYEYAETF